jgi:tetratricopeptide (TPR) repeat protein
MKFGPAEMAQTMEGAKALITVIFVSIVVIGIVLGALLALYRHFSYTLLVITILIATVGGGFFWYYTSMRSDFEATSNQRDIQPLPPTIEQQQVRSDFEATYNQLGIQPLPLTVERQQQIQSRLAQLSREPCYRDAVIGLGQALLDAGYPREAATSLRTFVKRCGSASEVLPYAYSALEKLNDFSAALDVANELVEAVPANGTFRYWRALAYDRTGQFSLAIVDYMNTVQLFGDPKIIFFDVFYKWSQTYAALGRRGGPALRDSSAAWLRWILGSITPPISPRLPA